MSTKKRTFHGNVGTILAWLRDSVKGRKQWNYKQTTF